MALVFLFPFSQPCEVFPDKLFCSNNISLELPPSRSATRKILLLRWGTPKYLASRTLQAREKLSPRIFPALFYLEGRGSLIVESLILVISSRTHLKSSPLLDEKAPGTFSHSRYLGYLPLVLHLISFITLVAS